MIGNSGTPATLLPGAPADAGPKAGAGVGTEPPGRRSRTRLLAAGGAVVLAGLAVGGFVLVNGSGADGPGGAVATHVTRGPTPGGSTSPTPSGAVTPVVPATGRNPFASPPGTSAAGTDPAAVGSSGGASPAASTVTATVTATPRYVGLYGFSGSKAVFWVNDAKYTVAVGGTFAGFSYTQKTSAGCAKVTASGTSTTLCPGTVQQLG